MCEERGRGRVNSIFLLSGRKLLALKCPRGLLFRSSWPEYGHNAEKLEKGGKGWL
jgi:hypothetical protein